MTKEIEIIGKAIGPYLMGKKVTTAEFINVIELCIDSFQKQIDDELILEKAHLIITEAQDITKVLKSIAEIAIRFS